MKRNVISFLGMTVLSLSFMSLTRAAERPIRVDLRWDSASTDPDETFFVKNSGDFIRLVAVRTGLLMVKAQGVEDFVDHVALAAPVGDVDGLLTTFPPNPRITAAISVILEVNVILFIRALH